MDPSFEAPFDYSNRHIPTAEWLRKHAIGKNKISPKQDRHDHNSIHLLVERGSDNIPIVTIDVNLEDTLKGWNGWARPFLHLSVSLQLDCARARIRQKQLDACLNYNGKEVSLIDDYKEKIEQYTSGHKLSLKYTRRKGWQLGNIKELREALDMWHPPQRPR